MPFKINWCHTLDFRLVNRYLVAQNKCFRLLIITDYWWQRLISLAKIWYLLHSSVASTMYCRLCVPRTLSMLEDLGTSIASRVRLTSPKVPLSDWWRQCQYCRLTEKWHAGVQCSAIRIQIAVGVKCALEETIASTWPVRMKWNSSSSDARRQAATVKIRIFAEEADDRDSRSIHSLSAMKSRF